MTKDEDASAPVGAGWSIPGDACCAGSSGGGRLSRQAILPPNHTPHFHSARAFHLDGCGGFAFELRANQIIGAARDLDDPALPMRFHAANLLATAIEAMAKTVASKVGEVAEHFEQLFYQSSRVGASVAGTQAFEFAFKQLGSSVGDADAALESFGYKLRTQPGFEGWVSRMGVATRDTNGQLRETSKIIPELAQHLQAIHNPALSNVFREALGGISDQGWRALNNPEFWKQYNTAISSEGAAGIDNDAATKAAEFEQQWREVWKRIGDMADGGTTKLLTALTEPMQKFNDWLDKNSPLLDQSIGRITKSFDNLAVQWTLDLSKLVFGDDQIKGIDDAAKSISHFLDTLTPLIRELEDFNQKSKDWWWMKLLDAGTSGPGAWSLPAGPGFVAGVGPGVGGDVSEAAGSWWKRNAPRWLGGVGAPAGIRARGAGGTPTGNEAALAKQAYAYWRGEGLSHDQALAVIGNERGENALGANGGFGDGGSAVGQFQWHADRRADIIRGTGIDPLSANFLDQQKAARWEMEHGQGGGHVWNALKNAKSREDAIWIMVHGFERSANQEADAAIRLGHADRYAKIISDGGAGGSAMAALAPGGAPKMSPAGGPWVKSQGRVLNR
jgi:hypothetical protein